MEDFRAKLRIIREIVTGAHDPGDALAAYFQVDNGGIRDYLRGYDALAKHLGEGITRAHVIALLQGAGAGPDPLIRWDIPREEVLTALEGPDVLRPALTGHDFFRLDLSDTGLRTADFSFTDLTGANLRDAGATGAIFTMADLTDTILEGAILDEANFQSANLTGAILENAVMFGADFSHARMYEANLQHAAMHKANFFKADLRQADFSYADVGEGATFDGADLRGTVLAESLRDYIKATASDCDLRGAHVYPD